MAEAAQLHAAKAERGHHWQLQVSVGDTTISFFQCTHLLVVFLHIVEFGTYAQPVEDIVLAHQAEADAPAVFILIIIEIMLVDDVMVIHATNVDADTPLG